MPVIEDNRPGSSNDHLNVNPVAQYPVIEDSVIEEPVLENNDIIKNELRKIDIPLIEEIFTSNDLDEKCIIRLMYIFTTFGYRVHPL